MTFTNDLGCDHPDQRHTVWWSECDPTDPWEAGAAMVPMAATYDTRQEAVDAATRIRDDVEGGRRSPRRTSWIKVFRSDNETYTCWRWPGQHVEDA